MIVVCLAWLISTDAASAIVRPSHRVALLEDRFLKPKTDVAEDGEKQARHEAANATGMGALDPFASEHFYGNLKCGETVQVGSKDHKFEMCPEECPYYAQDLEDDLHCSFVCVSAANCKVRNPKRPIADVIMGHKTCRGPMVTDCSEYNYDGTDSCAKCQLFYKVGGDGQCYFQHGLAAKIVIGLLVGIVLLFVLWMVDCCMRPKVNSLSVQKGENFRSLQKIRRSTDKELFDFYTPLWKEDVAGPGMVLHFNLHIFLIIWSLVVAVIWLCMALFIDDALFILGTRRFGTPRENCILVAWGYETQQRLMWTKVTFLIIVYIVTFFATLGHAVRQQHLYETLASKKPTMMHYVALLTGLPPISGADEKAEEEIQQFLQDSGFNGVFGVSIAWNYLEEEDKVMMLLEDDLMKRDEKYQTKEYKDAGSKWREVSAEDSSKYGLTDIPASGSEVTEQQRMAIEQKNFKMQDLVNAGLVVDETWKRWQEKPDPDYSNDWSNPVRRRLHRLEVKLLAGEEISSEELTRAKQKEFLQSLQSSPDAFIVFETKKKRDDALEQGFTEKFRDTTVKLEEMVCEPDTVNWRNFGDDTNWERFLRLLRGFGAMLLALFFWTTVFYAPYAYQVFCFNYDNGAQPGPMLAFAFCMVVVLGNAIMCEVCAQVSDSIGFKTRDARESCYLILYVIACMFNVFMDMITTYFLAEYILDGLGFRTYYGVRFQDVPTFTERFETYAMQRMLAENTKAYSFPASFLVPFLIEPFITIIFPYLAGALLVGVHKEWVGRDAEKLLVAFEFDMGRYGDLLLNMFLAMLIFFFPGGYTLVLFFGMAGSHVYIYMFDHARVLRTIPQCIYASIDVDWWGTWMMAPITAMIPMCLVFKANCQDYGYCIKGISLIEAMWVAFILHAIIHTLLFVYIVPKFKPPANTAKEFLEKDYVDVAAEFPCNWFTSNPIHCLRSQHMHYPEKSDKYCTFAFSGKAHLHNYNKEKGWCYKGKEATGEDFSMSRRNLPAPKSASQKNVSQ